MSSSDYDFSLTTFSPSGKLVQIEYALRAVAASSLCLGLVSKSGVVLATEKKTSSLLVDSASITKCHSLASHVGCVSAGMLPDALVIVRAARRMAMEYHRMYSSVIPVPVMVAKIATLMQEFTQSGGVRPFGCSLLVGGVDDQGAHLFQVDPSGAFWAWKASSVGKNMANANTFLEKRFSEDMELEDAVHTALLTLKEGFDGILTKDNIELAIAKKESKTFAKLEADDLKAYLEEVEKW